MSQQSIAPKIGSWEPQDAPCRNTDELTQEYLASLVRRVSTIYLFGEEEARALDKVFVELSIIEEYRRPTVHDEFLGLMDAEMRQRRSAFTRAEDEREPRTTGDLRGAVKRMVKPDELLCARTKAVVTGAPGCGKTTLLRYLAWRTHESDERLPVFLELKTVTEGDFTRAQHDLAVLLFERGVAGTLGLRGAERERLREAFMSRLAAGGVAIFLDGLDEVSGTDFFPQLCESVVEFIRREHRENTLVISTRPYALQSRLEGLKEMEIAPLNQRQIGEFFAHYYCGDPVPQQLLRTLRQRRSLREILRVPFLLAVVMQLYRLEPRITDDRLELYRLLVWQLVAQLDREKRLVRRDFRIPDRTGALKLDFLKYLACQRLLIDDIREEGEGREAARLIFTGDVILGKAKQFWKNAAHSEGNPYDLADDVKNTPLLREVGTNVYAFTHLTIQEYLAAVELARRPDCEEIFCRAYFNSTLAGMEVLPMTFGQVRHPEKLYAALEQMPESLTFTSLRLRARGLAYVLNPDRQLLTHLAEDLLAFVEPFEAEERAYRKVVLRSLSEARTQSLQVIIEHITALLQNSNENVRVSAALALGEIGGECALNALLPLLKDEDYTLRRAAVDALGEIGGERALNSLLSLLKDEDIVLHWPVRWEAAYALGKIGSERAFDALLSLLIKDSDQDVRRAAGYALGQIGGERALNALLPLLKDEDIILRQAAAYGLGALGDERASDALLSQLKYRDHVVDRHTIEALSKVGGGRAMDALLLLLKEGDSLVCPIVASALGQICGERAIDALLPLLNDANGTMRWRAAEALGKLGDDRAIDTLLPLLNDEYERARSGVTEALGRIGGERAVEALLKVLVKDESRIVRYYAASALGKNDSAVLAVTLVRALWHEDELVRQKAAQIVGYYSEGEQVLHELARLATEDSSEEVRSAANEACGKYERKLAYFR